MTFFLQKKRLQFHKFCEHFLVFLKDAKVKKEAGGVLGDVRRKQGDSSRSLSLLQALKKLRSFRRQEAEVKGVLYQVYFIGIMLDVLLDNNY